MEVTKLSKPSTQRVACGNSASRQAVTRVNAEQASKDQDAGPVWVPKTASAGRINTTRAGGDVRERAYATRG
jgi:hypothetical protein